MDAEGRSYRIGMIESEKGFRTWYAVWYRRRALENAKADLSMLGDETEREALGTMPAKTYSFLGWEADTY